MMIQHTNPEIFTAGADLDQPGLESRRRALIVDDEVNTVEILKIILMNSGKPTFLAILQYFLCQGLVLDRSPGIWREGEDRFLEREPGVRRQQYDREDLEGAP